ncbi:mechanosensitive ion channel family protein [Aeromicrobium massiliense]|uniref:mechanosensitive ion channel family protein n=1 Tax=Aeromicrobium massiliense TaxID=1464554 RepID=UPI000578AEE7|nr:mechanosensitive ion channel domain-containing protein [Aeromicrobium massiliense]
MLPVAGAAWSLDVPVAGLHLTVSSVLWAIAASLVTVLAARYAARAVMRVSARVQGIADDVALQAARVARYGVIVVGVGVVLAILGAPIQPLLATVLVLLAGTFLLVRGIADNFGAGLAIQTRHPIRLGDLVEAHGYRGHVSDLTSRSVVLVTLDGRTVHLPNRLVMDEPLVNESAHGRTRLDLQVRVDVGPDQHEAGAAALGTEAVADVLVHAVAGLPGVLDSPAPSALLCGAEPGRLTFLLHVWHDPGSGPQVASRVTHAVAAPGSPLHRGVAVEWPPPPAAAVKPRDL